MTEVIDATLQAAGTGVVLFSKTSCGYCWRAKRALASIGIVPVVLELDERRRRGRGGQEEDDGRAIQIALLQRTGQRTVPSVWLNGKFIGGSDAVMAGIQSGLFHDAVAANDANRLLCEEAGLKPCGVKDGEPCLWFE